jgi:hypothetical protein
MSGRPSDVSNATVEARSDLAMRAALGMWTFQRADGQNPSALGVFAAATKVQRVEEIRENTSLGRWNPKAQPWFEFPQDKFRLLRSRRCSSASSRAISSRKPNISSRWLRASCARSAVVSAIRATASSGPPSKPDSLFGERRSLPEDARLRRLLAFFKQNLL